MKKEFSPFQILDIKLSKKQKIDYDNSQIWAKLYWSKNAGLYGYQVIIEYNAGQGWASYTTSGCGYCKATQALEHFYKELFDTWKSFHGDLNYLSRGTKYSKGGNFYEMTLNQFKKLGVK